MGKSGIVMKKIAATLASTGTPAFFLHPAEAIHGDLGMLVAGDIVLAAIVLGHHRGAAAAGRDAEADRRRPDRDDRQPRQPAARSAADLHLSVAIDKEACPLNLAPTASTTATLALGDALAMALLEARGFTPEDFARFHPGGRLGKSLSAVGPAHARRRRAARGVDRRRRCATRSTRCRASASASRR
jgi:arabinose-5-phosphate isomerase